MAEHPYMPFFPEKFLADTLHIPWDASGAYAVLLMVAWARGGSLPNDEDQLRLMVRCSTKAWRKIWPDIAPFWTVGEDGRLHQKRMDKEWQRVTEARSASVASGNVGGRKSAQEKTSSDSRGSFSSGKKPNDFYARARAGQPSHNPHTDIEEEDSLERESLPPKTRARKSLLSENWMPEKAEAQFAYDKGLSERELAAEIQRFRDTSLANGKQFANIPAAWRAWITSPHAPRHKGGSNGANRKPSLAELARRQLEQLEREEREESSVCHLQLVSEVRR